MKTSLTDTKLIEEYLNGTTPKQDSAVVEARLLLEPELQQKLRWQNLTYHLVCLYGRKKLKAEIEAVHQKLFSEPEHISFRQKIHSIFFRR